MSKILKNQGYHLLVYILLGGMLYVAVRYLPESGSRVWGLSACWWLAISWIFAGAHQVYVVFNWRLELHHRKISAWFGKVAFPIYRTVFYFGLSRLVGADHFDPKYRGGSLETRGIFKYIPNSMYTVALLMFYHPGLLCHSTLGVVGAAAQHALVWTHYFCTEKPDMKEIYGG